MERKINKNQFRAYERVRQSGETNMFDVSTVMLLALPTILTKEDCLAIMKNYEQLSKDFA